MRELAVGIDLGTTYSVVAYVDEHGRPQTMRNRHGNLITPSAVYVEHEASGESLFTVGEEALRLGHDNHATFADEIKNDMGKAHYHKLLGGQQYSPDFLSSEILRDLRRSAEEQERPFTKAVVTVPAYFTNQRRRATLEAGRLAELDVLAIINEPTAAALALGFEDGFLNANGTVTSDENILVYDLGGGTFDATVLRIRKNEYQVLASVGNPELGGRKWDHYITNFVAQEFERKHRRRGLVDDPEFMHKAREIAESTKKSLSTRETANVQLSFGGDLLKVSYSRKQFEADIAGDLGLTRSICREAFELAKSPKLSRIVLVGGSTRVPAVSHILEEEFEIKPSRVLSPDEAVAHGAALFAQIKLSSGKIREVDATANGIHSVNVQDVTTHDLGVRVRGKELPVVIIPRATPLPARCTNKFQIPADGIRRMRFRATESVDVILDEQIPRAPDQLPANLKAGTPVRLTYSYDTNGTISGLLEIPSANPPYRYEFQIKNNLPD